jgi:hypothetical protein
MTLEGLVGFLVVAAICGLLAFLAALLLRMRMSVLAYVGAGLIGRAIGIALAHAIHGTGWPGNVALMGEGVHLLFTFFGALLVLLIVKLLGRARAR